MPTHGEPEHERVQGTDAHFLLSERAVYIPRGRAIPPVAVYPAGMRAQMCF